MYNKVYKDLTKKDQYNEKLIALFLAAVTVAVMIPAAGVSASGYVSKQGYFTYTVKDNTVNLSDASLILKYIANWDVVLG